MTDESSLPQPETLLIGDGLPTESSTTRRFSKCLTVSNMLVMAALAAFGLASGRSDTAEVLTAYGMWSSAAIITYMAIGLGDFRTSRGIPGLLDALTLLVTRGRDR